MDYSIIFHIIFCFSISRNKINNVVIPIDPLLHSESRKKYIEYLHTAHVIIGKRIVLFIAPQIMSQA